MLAANRRAHAAPGLAAALRLATHRPLVKQFAGAGTRFKPGRGNGLAGAGGVPDAVARPGGGYTWASDHHPSFKTRL